MSETWDVTYPDAGATGLPFLRSKVDPDAAGDRVLIHAAPKTMQVVVTDEDGNVVAESGDLERTQEGPMSYLVREDGKIKLDEGWPGDSDIGRVVLLPGGEAGILKSWWHADDHSSWRWQVEFSNSR